MHRLASRGQLGLKPEARRRSDLYDMECARSQANGSRGEEKRFWASVLTFEQIHILIAEAEHSWQALTTSLNALELRENDLRAKLRRTEARFARVGRAEAGLKEMLKLLAGVVRRTEATTSQTTRAGKRLEELMRMLFDVELLRGCVDKWHATEPDRMPDPTDEHMTGEWIVDSDGVVVQTSQAWSYMVRSWMLGGEDIADEYWNWDMEDEIGGDLASVSACVIAAGSLESVFEYIRRALPNTNLDAVDGGTRESAQDKEDQSLRRAWPQMRRLRMSDLQYTRASITGVGRGESTLESLLRDLRRRKLDPTSCPYTVMDVVKVNDVYYSDDNRRLNVLRDYMHSVGRDVHVWCRVFEWHHSYEVCVGCLTDQMKAECRTLSARTVPQSAITALPQPIPLRVRSGFRDHCGSAGQRKRQYGNIS